MRALETRCSPSRGAASTRQFHLAEEEYGLPILTAHPYVRH
jgi:hypothetical protein